MNYVGYEKKESIAIITLNRPEKLNALSRELLEGFLNALRAASKDPEVRAVVITAAGKAFCAGADVTEFAKDPTDVAEFIDLGRKVFELVESLEKPVIAAVHGVALGGGFELALACDLVVASTDAQFGSPEVNLGLVPGWGATQKLLFTVGPHKARELIMLGEKISAEEALRLGVVNKVVPAARVLEEAVALASKLAEKSPMAVAAAKRIVNKSLEFLTSAGLEVERQVFINTISTQEARARIQAFLEKRRAG
ncbi:enoyl-CoA hydratase/isomerase family protein [Candidatus Bipolaricaulota bacterium]|nr:enoyl-CoA hydratase/isomerase family protein [Candidatus Bipolaricaulota bacterium]